MSILSNWLVKLVIFLAVVATVGINFTEVVIAHVGGQDDAANAAYSAAQSYGTTHDAATALEIAKEQLPSNVTLVGCTIGADGVTWTCTVKRRAHTFLMQDIGFLKKYTWATESGSGSYSP